MHHCISIERKISTQHPIIYYVCHLRKADLGRDTHMVSPENQIKATTYIIPRF